MRVARQGLLLVAALAVAACDKSGDGTPPVATAVTPPAATSAAAASTAATTAAAAASEDPAAAAAAAAEEEQAAKSLRRHHRHHHHGGVAMFIHMAIDTLGVSPEKQAQIEKIQSDLHASMAPSREAGRNVLAAVADGVAAGSLDTAKVNAALAKQEAATAAVHAATINALNQLHDALSPAERAALVDKVEAHVEVWKKNNHDEDHGSKDKAGRLGALAEEIGLTQDQVDKISEALKKDAPAKPDAAALDAHIKAFHEAFVADKFDAKAQATDSAANSYVSRNGTGHLVRFYKIVTPLLTPEQRPKLAEHLRERLNDSHAAK